MKRRRMSKSGSKKSFTRNAIKTDPKNLRPTPKRGGYRL